MIKYGVNYDIPLPQWFKLTLFFCKKKKPANLRFHKVSPDKEVERYWFSECLLYNPLINEDDIGKKS